MFVSSFVIGQKKTAVKFNEAKRRPTTCLTIDLCLDNTLCYTLLQIAGHNTTHAMGDIQMPSGLASRFGFRFEFQILDTFHSSRTGGNIKITSKHGIINSFVASFTS